jgi:hypothetical protein
MGDFISDLVKRVNNRSVEIVKGRPMGTVKDMIDDWKYKQKMEKSQPGDNKKSGREILDEWFSLPKAEQDKWGSFVAWQKAQK